MVRPAVNPSELQPQMVPIEQQALPVMQPQARSEAPQLLAIPQPPSADLSAASPVGISRLLELARAEKARVELKAAQADAGAQAGRAKKAEDELKRLADAESQPLQLVRRAEASDARASKMREAADAAIHVGREAEHAPRCADLVSSFLYKLGLCEEYAS